MIPKSKLRKYLKQVIDLNIRAKIIEPFDSEISIKFKTNFKCPGALLKNKQQPIKTAQKGESK